MYACTFGVFLTSGVWSKDHEYDQKLSNEEDRLKSFVNLQPKGPYAFDSERDAKVSELCRGSGMNEKDCIKLQMSSRRLFKAMQDQGFYCALPMEPGRTHMVCKPLFR
ncbi:hypothetical protein FA13DRAFT_1209860 [Coprinellus micaceus]|uniref:Uncharacterized protein n=1 Tax=Coprinellus micaceus TaxID=71717 RepID=A0A4Y7TQZ1_COPMI|nr:hypothetical protein FA13DRAFT_1209860 [Coprinellus micaceus]